MLDFDIDIAAPVFIERGNGAAVILGASTGEDMSGIT